MKQHNRTSTFHDVSNPPTKAMLVMTNMTNLSDQPPTPTNVGAHHHDQPTTGPAKLPAPGEVWESKSSGQQIRIIAEDDGLLWIGRTHTWVEDPVFIAQYYRPVPDREVTA